MNKKFYNCFLAALSFFVMSGVAYSQAPPVQWEKTYGGTSYDEAVSVKATPDGGSIQVGTSLSSDGNISAAKGNYDIWAVKTDASGAIQWQTSAGSTLNDYASDVELTLDGGYIIAGYTDSTRYGQRDYYVLKLDATGALVWENKYGGSGNDMARSVYSTLDGGYVIAGTSNSTDGQITNNHKDYDYWVVKVNGTGALVWQSSYGGGAYDEAKSIQQTADGGYIVAGYSYSADQDLAGKHNSTTSKADYWLVKLTSAGAITWSQNYGGTSDDFASYVRELSAGGYIIAGTSFSTDVNVTGHHGISTTSDAWIVKTDAAGSLVWQTSLGGNSTDGANEVQEVSSGGFIVAGYAKSSDGNVSSNHGGFDYWAVRLSAAGALTWEKTTGGTLDEKAASVQELSDGGFLFTGLTQSSNGDVVSGLKGDRDYWLVKIGGACIKPVPMFILSTTSVCPQTKLSFTNQTGGNITNYQWKVNGVNYSTAKDTDYVFTTPGSYAVRLIAYKGSSCIDSTEQTVTVNPNPAVPTVTSSTGSFAYCNTSSIDLISSAQATYQWYKNGSALSSQTNQNLTVNDSLSATYKVVVKDVNGCSAVSANVAVTVNPLPLSSSAISITKTIFCEGDSAILQAPKGFTYLWSDNSTTSSIVVKISGTYSVTITNSFGCSRGLAAVSTTMNPKPLPAITAATSTTFCAGDSVTLTADPGFVTYRWTNGLTSTSIDAKQSGNYKVTVSDSKGCTNTSNTITVTANPLPADSIAAGGPIAFCVGGSVVLNSKSTFSSYDWYRDNTAVPGANSQTYPAITTGDYTVKVTDGNGCTAFSQNNIKVQVDTIPDATITVYGKTAVCYGDSVRLAAHPGYKIYHWSNNDSQSSTEIKASGTYSVTVSSNAGCSASSSSPVTISIKTPLTVSAIASGPASFCQGDSVTLSSSSAAAATKTYKWSNGLNDPSIIVKTSGSYYLSIVDTAGCVSDTSAHIKVTVNAIPSSTITSNTGKVTFCTGDSVHLSVPSGNTYLWSPNGETTATITSKNIGVYSVTVTSAAGCTSSSKVTTIAYPLPNKAIIIARGKTTFCQGDSIALIDSSGQANSTYKWSTGKAGPFIVARQAGTYFEVVTNSYGCSRSSNAITISVNPLPSVSIAASGATTFCEGGSVNLTASGLFKFAWVYTYLSQTYYPSTNKVLKANKSGNYYVIVTDNNQCQNTSNVIPVNVVKNPVVSITALGKIRFCEGNSVSLDAGSGYTTYNWSNSAISRSISVSTSGNYSVTVTNSTGCTGTAQPVTVTVDSVPAVPTVTNTLGLLTSSATSGNQWYFNGTAIDSATAQTYIALVSGTYKVRVTNIYGCYSESAPINVVTTPHGSGIEDALAGSSLNLFPNPYSDKASISYELVKSSTIRLEVFNLLGEKVSILVNGDRQTPGKYVYDFRNLSGKENSGTYVVRLTVGDAVYNRRLVQIR